MNFPFEKIVNSEAETFEVATELSSHINAGDVIALNGELGSGKTFFIKSVCEQFGIFNVSSPTFAIVNEYCGEKKIYHFDFFRINKTNELHDIGFTEYLNDQSTVIFIEWAELFHELIPPRRFEILLMYANENSREIKINKYD